MISLENIILTNYSPDLIITPGDVNSTLAVSIAANKLNIKLAHLESGLRSFDRSMPEEINRVIADELADYYFVTERSAIANLKAEGKKGEIYFVGNTMIDTLVDQEENIVNSDIKAKLQISEPFILSTFHRPATVDNFNGLKKLIEMFESLTEKFKVVFPVHPRTKYRLKEFGLDERIADLSNLLIIDPLGYIEFQRLVKDCTLVITDSGGIQEETTYRKVPCLTVRDSTERPVTIDVGSNILTEFDVQMILEHVESVCNGKFKKGEIPELWDGSATERILKICNEIL
ncbi:MAG: UDP-N-acetylglucosamine 2-epimerase (non-hydrolyzing) [Crocinitomicaceae bacterium]|nr:UDP-N-acetylglucosamine 2-epimerase (non-hydrolyzing) [Crocinitomicaceae bacterium]